MESVAVILGVGTEGLPKDGRITGIKEIIFKLHGVAQPSLVKSRWGKTDEIILDITEIGGSALVAGKIEGAVNGQILLLVLEGNGVAFFVPKSDMNIGYLASQVTLYFDAGTTPTARIFAGNSTQHTSLIVTLVVYFVPTE